MDIRRRDASRILDDQRTVNFDASSGELLHAQPSYAPGYATYGWLTGLHMIQWGGQLVRWMYLLLGLSGAMMIFGGLQVWLAKREARGSLGVGLVRALNLAVCGGLPLASLALLWGNRLLPTQLAGRDTWEIRVFCASWALVALWAIVRRNSGTLGRTQLRSPPCWRWACRCSACCVARKATCWPACSAATGCWPASTSACWASACSAPGSVGDVGKRRASPPGDA